MAVTIGDSAQPYAIGDFPQRSLFYANGRYWVFFGDGSGANSIRFVSSTDGTSWTAESGVPQAQIYLGRSYMFSVWSDGTYVYLAWTHSATAIKGQIKYKRGLLNANGTITWDAWETVDSNTGMFRPAICKASDGKIWVVMSQKDVHYIRYNVRNGSWGAPTILKGGFPNQIIQGIIPLSSGGKIYVVYSVNGTNKLYGFHWNGSGWDAEESISADVLLSYGYWSLTIDGNDHIHICYRIGADGSGRIKHVKRTTSWQSPVSVHDGGLSGVYPVISANPNNSYVYCFWHSSNTFYYKRYDGTNWDASATTVDTDTNVQAGLGCFWWVQNSDIGIAYNRGTGSPYDVRFILFDEPAPPAVSTGMMDGFVFIG